MKLRLSLPAAMFLLAGCGGISDRVTSFMGGEDNAEPPSPLVEIDTRVKVTRLWGNDMGKGSGDRYLKLAPVYAQETIYVAEYDGEIKAVNTTNGKIIWSQDADARITGGPGAGDSLVMVGTGEAEILTFSAETGESLWRGKVSSEVLSAPQVSNNIVVVRTIDGKIYGLDAADGNSLWVYDRTVPALTLRGTSSPIIAGDLVISGFDGGRLTAIELYTGKPVWEARIALGSGRSELERMIDIDAEPVVVDDVIYVATYQGRIAAVTLDGGRILWTRDISSHAGLCADESAVYITDDNSHIWALDRFTGNSLWKQEKLQARAITAPATIGDMVVVADLEGYLHWLERESGEFVARVQASKNKIIAPPISVGGILYSYASDGILGAYTYDSLQTGIVLDSPSAGEIPVTDDKEPAIQQDKNEKKEDTGNKRGVLGRFWDFITPGTNEEIVEENNLDD
jgi:outer membrane protein assembly factor BamB